MNNSPEIQPSLDLTKDCWNRVRLEVRGLGHVQAFKNRKRAIVTKSGKQRTLTEPGVKERMDAMENAILSQLLSMCRTASGETDLECRKRLRTLLFGLSDDSLNQIPIAAFDVEYCEVGKEGFAVVIERL